MKNNFSAFDRIIEATKQAKAELENFPDSDSTLIFFARELDEALSTIIDQVGGDSSYMIGATETSMDLALADGGRLSNFPPPDVATLEEGTWDN